MPACLRMELHGAVAVVTLDRAPANALNHMVMQEIAALLPKLAEPWVRAVVLTGQGRTFSAGLDLFEVFSYPPDQAAEFARSFDDALIGLFALELPVVAAINGHAIAGGAILAAAADFRLVIDDGAKLGVPELLVGVPFPTSALEIMRYACAGPHLHEVLLRGRTYGPAEAVARRLADEVVPAAELSARALALAEELATPPRDSFAATKRGLRHAALSRMRAVRTGGEDPVWSLWRTPEVQHAAATYRARIGSGRRAGS